MGALVNASTAVPPSGKQSEVSLPQMHITFILVAVVLASLAVFIVVYFIFFRTIHINLADWDQRRYREGIIQRATQIIIGSAEEEAIDNRVGLEASHVSSLPILQYSSDWLKEEARRKGGRHVQNIVVVVVKECAVCLSEFEEGEEMKVLPVCGHCFHKACIDEWLSSHTTCPICRRSLLTQIDDNIPAGAGAGAGAGHAGAHRENVEHINNIPAGAGAGAVNI